MPSTTQRDYYDVLGIGREADEREIKSAYRKLALEYHPDRNPDDAEAEARFKEAAEAYSVLGDADKRRRYDQFGHAGVGGAGGGGFDPTIFSDFGDILGDLFGFGDIFGRRSSGPRRGVDLRYNLELSLEESAFGTETNIQIPRAESCEACGGDGNAAGSSPSVCPTCQGHGQIRFQQGPFSVARTCSHCRGAGRIVTNPCPDCQGQGIVQQERKLQIQIPAGVDTGSQLRITGEGEQGRGGGPRGDLYVVVHVREHAFFKRDGTTLFCEIPISFSQAALGAQVEIPTLDGESARLDITAGSQSGATLSVRGQGVPRLGGRGRGDLLVRVRVHVPTKLSGEQRKLIKTLGESLPTPTRHEKERGFFERLKDFLGLRQKQVLAFEVTGPPSFEELAVSACWEAGTLGLQTLPGAPSEFHFVAYFPRAGEAAPRAPAGLVDLAGVEARSVPVPEIDWVARFREGFEAFDVGLFSIVPAWRPDASPGSVALVVDPGHAFGTGTHETTRLCLKALTRAGRDTLKGARVLDLGSGSGILAIAAMKLGARSVVAIEVDPDAAREARRHAVLNQVRLAIVNGDLASALRGGWADLVLANLQAPLLVSRAEQIRAAARTGGLLVLSGLLTSDTAAIQSAYAAFGETRAYEDGEWVAIEVRL